LLAPLRSTENGGNLEITENERVRISDGAIAINPVSLGDAGKYNCLALNSFGHAEKSINVYIRSEPIMLEIKSLNTEKLYLGMSLK
jgi:hypothetical protein